MHRHRLPVEIGSGRVQIRVRARVGVEVGVHMRIGGRRPEGDPLPTLD